MSGACQEEIVLEGHNQDIVLSAQKMTAQDGPEEDAAHFRDEVT